MKKILLSFLSSLLLIAPVLAADNSVLETVSSTLASTTITSSTEPQPETPSSENVGSVIETFDEPNIFVGLFKTTKAVKFSSKYVYQIFAGDENLGELKANEVAELSFKNGVYSLKSKSLNLKSKVFFDLKSMDENAVFDLPGCTLTFSGRKKTYCSYRGSLEFRYSKKSNTVQVINELPLEDYMKGIAETDNNAAEGYIKAVLVAARSYAYSNISKTGPSEKRMFDVFASTQDQLYLGYRSEIEMSRVAQFAVETSGEMVSYNFQPVVTPYFSRSGGYTKEWKNASGVNDRPWLISVECEYDKGKKKAGHGVGMSTYDALMKATKDGWNYRDLLQYYYTNTVVEKFY